MTFSLKKSKWTLISIIGFVIIISLWQPEALIYGIQRGSLYAVIALPLSLVLGIMGILNLAHGEFLTIGFYIAYMLNKSIGLDPLVAIIPVTLILLFIGAIVHLLTIKRVLNKGHLPQLLLTFGISMIIIEIIKIFWTTRPRNIYTAYASSSVNIGKITIGAYEFLYIGIALLIFFGLRIFLKKTRLGQATFAVGQNPRGAKIVGINNDFVYLFVFSLAAGILGIVACIMLPRTSIFPLTGNPYSLKSFALVAMAGLGNINGILLAGITLGIGEAIVQAIPGYGSWADLVFFGVLIAVILINNFREA